MSREEMLPADLLFDEDGHLSEICLVSLADGQMAIIPPGPLGHLEHCGTCAARVGHAALASLAVGEAMAPAPLVARRPHPVPVRALVGALALLAASSTPALLDALRSLPGALGAAGEALSPLARALALLARSADAGLGSLAALASVGAAMFLMATGLFITQLSPQHLSGEPS